MHSGFTGLGSDDEHMVSRIFLSLETSGQVTESTCDIKQTVGSTYLAGPVEVGRPLNYKGPYNHRVFCEEIDKYYKSIIGPDSAGIQVGGPGLGAKMRMWNNSFEIPHEFAFEASDESESW